MRVIRWVVLAALGSVAVFSQTPPWRLEFEVASINSSSLSTAAQANAGQVNVGVQIDGAQVHCANLSLTEYIRAAYRVKEYQVVGPDWLASERFDVSAKLPAGAKREQVPEMLQTLLRDRFGLPLHHETRERPVFALVVANGGAKLQAIDSATGCDGEGDDIGHVLACRDTVARLAEALSRYAGRPVIDQTHLPGVFEMKLQWLRDAPDDPVAATLMEALPKQLGFRLEAQKAPGDFIVVDSANQVPTDN